MSETPLEIAHKLAEARSEFRRAVDRKENAATLIALADTVDACYADLIQQADQITLLPQEQREEISRLISRRKDT
jgi:hypothetical protein